MVLAKVHLVIQGLLLLIGGAIFIMSILFSGNQLVNQ